MKANFVTLTEAREASGLTRTELAARVDIPRGTLYNWESGRCFPSDNGPLKAVAAELGVPVRRLVL